MSKRLHEGANDQRADCLTDGSCCEFALEFFAADEPSANGYSSKQSNPEALLFCFSQILEGDFEGGAVVGVVLVVHQY